MRTSAAENVASRSSPWVITVSVLTTPTQLKQSATRVGLKSASSATVEILQGQEADVPVRQRARHPRDAMQIQYRRRFVRVLLWNGNRTRQPDVHSANAIHRQPNYRSPEAKGINKQHARHFAENILQGLDLISRPQGMMVPHIRLEQKESTGAPDSGSTS